ncbi:suppressor of cytokine signaling 2-like [Latimeria chalumnae]|uniref:suppressor of cytokine signaling 2-like n=1 Tax=Latimeria chalumnae TaxID=7897 RepID=UPI00313D10C7
MRKESVMLETNDFLVCKNCIWSVVFIFIGWYWGSLSAMEAKEVLNRVAEGTFLLRDSSNPDYLLTLSVKTSLGPTHIRIQYNEGKFGFDSVLFAKPKLKSFENAVELVQFYNLMSQHFQTKTELKGLVLVGAKEPMVHLKLTRPLYAAVSSLQHLCRVMINRASKDVEELPLPPRLKEYVSDYPFFL